MSQEERDRLEWLKRAQDKVISQRKAAQNMGVSDRWVRQLLWRMKSEGDGVVVHRLRGRASNRKIRAESPSPSNPDPKAAGLARLRADLRERAVGQAARPSGGQGNLTRMDDAGRPVAAELAQDSGGALLAPPTQRVWRTGAVGHVHA